ncbi:MAG: hypothetical protein M4579_003210 [Chaenotheca gracillima]|nr:MAG: hypothetical protein M4579_003210 [Chaenotheca gracillima]
MGPPTSGVLGLFGGDQARAAILHPYNLVLLQAGILGTTAVYTKPSSIIRYSAVVVIASLSYTYISICHDKIESIGWAALGGSLSFSLIPIAIDRLLLSRWNFDLGGPESYRSRKDGKRIQRTEQDSGVNKESGKPARKSAWDKLWFMTDVILTPRGAGRPWEVKNTPHFFNKDPSYVPSRGAFLLRWIVRTTALFLAVDFMSAQPPPPDIKSIFDLAKIPFFRRLPNLTKDELVVRGMSTFAYWTTTYSMLSIFTSAFAILCVGSGISEPAAWRPNFGSPMDLYSIRNFWGLWWHQNLRSTFEGFSDFITEDLLHIPKGTLTSRYSKIFVPFIISGLLHYGSDLASTLSFREAGAFHFFLTQAFGIVLEDAVTASYRYVTGQAKDAKAPTPLWQKLVGYVWVGAFQFWSTPMWSYPQIRISNPKDSVMPFSFFK